jgi:hypothetical protein
MTRTYSRNPNQQALKARLARLFAASNGLFGGVGAGDIGGLVWPNVRVERRLADGAAGGKVSARTRGWAPAWLQRSDLSTAALAPPRLIAALCQRSSCQTTPAFSDWGAACYGSKTTSRRLRTLGAADRQHEPHGPAFAGGRVAGHLERTRPEGAPPALHEPLRRQLPLNFAACFARATFANHYLSFAGAQRST